MQRYLNKGIIFAAALIASASIGSAEERAVLFRADFATNEIPPPLFERFPKMEVVDGVLRVSQEKRHAASPTLPVSFESGEMRFRFKLDESTQLFVCRFEDKSRVEKAHSHLCRVEVLPGRVSLKLDRPPKDHAYREAIVLSERSLDLVDGEWHDVLIRFAGDSVSVAVDGELILEGNHPHLRHEKTATHFVLRGGGLRLDDIELSSHSEEPSPKLLSDSRKSLTIFHDYVEPLLIENCYECHSHEAKKAKGGLVVDSLNPMLKGGDLGPALLPGNPEGSLLYEAIEYHNTDLQMPPDAKLDALAIEKVREWIALGASHPRTGPEIEETKYSGPRSEDLWSIKPFQIGESRGGDSGAIDRLLEETLAAADVVPSPDAEPHEILRRLHYVLTGLPPSLEEREEFLRLVEEGLPRAIEEWADRLLASEHFGERWGRHWLDIARYADVSGSTNPKPYPEAWRFRQWVIHSFNSDKPWDDFVREQLSGDLLESGNPAERTEQLLGTGYLALSHVLAVDRDKERLKLDTIDEQLDVIGRTFLGIQIGCARCHDHKIDPFPTADYYAMAGIFRSTKTVKASASQETLETEGAELTHRDETLPFWMQGGKGVKIPSTSDEEVPRDEPIHLRGELDMLGDVVPRGFPTMLAPVEARPIPDGASGRSELADYLLHEKNYLQARLIVNRVWHHVFGQGIVRTTDNFGLTGDLPSHPELLDLLAVRFRDEHELSFKSLIRELVTTKAFRRSSRAREDALAVDPENRLLWRANLRRGDAEALVDAIQSVARTIDLEPGGYAVPEFKRGNQASTFDLEIPKSTLRKRAVYWPVFRKDIPMAMDVLSIFDFPAATAPRGNRSPTRVPAQSLALLNSPIVLNAARSMQVSLSSVDDESRVRELYLRALAREPREAELKAVLEFIASFSGGIAEESAAKPENVSNVAWNRLCHTLLVSNEFITIP